MAIYYVYSGAGGSNNGSSWANAFTTLTTAFATEVAGDTLYVAQDHSESTGAAITLTSSGTVANPSKIICVDRAGTVPPVSADRRTTAAVATTGSNAHINFAGFAHYDGIIFTAGAAANAASIFLPSTGSGVWLRFDNCSLRLGNTAAPSRIYAGNQGTAPGANIELNNTTLSFGSVSQLVDVCAWIRWRNTPTALVGATIPSVLFSTSVTRGGILECIGVDLSAAASGKTLVGNAAGTINTYKFVDCKLDAAVTKSVVPVAHGTCEIDFISCAGSGINYAVHRHRVSGLLTEETTIVRTGGASAGTPISWKVVTTANCHYSIPFECPVIAIWNDTTGSAVTATVEGIWGGGAVPLNDEIWLDVEYLGDASSPQASFVNDGKANLLATAANQSSSSETWGGSTTKFKLETTFTAQQEGWLYCRCKIGKASTTAYIDPLVTLS